MLLAPSLIRADSPAEKYSFHGRCCKVSIAASRACSVARVDHWDRFPGLAFGSHCGALVSWSRWSVPVCSLALGSPESDRW